MFASKKYLEGSNLSGFTIIELLVVIFIIGLFSSFVLISISDSFLRELRNEAENFQKIIISSSEEAIFSSSELALDLDNNGYSLLKLDRLSGSWIPFNFHSSNYYNLPESIEIIWKVEGFTYANSGSLDVNKGYLKNIINTETYNDNFEGTPDIFLMSSGEISVFEVYFIAKDDKNYETIFRLKSDGFSSPSIERVYEINLDEEYIY
jgi:general secretion pathway protein H